MMASNTPTFVDENGIYVRVQHFKKDEKWATVIPTIHIASATFFLEIQKLISQTPRFVLTEGVRGTNNTIQEFVSPTLLDVEALQDLNKVGMNVILQPELIDKDNPRAVHADFSMNQMIKALQRRGFDFATHNSEIESKLQSLRDGRDEFNRECESGDITKIREVLEAEMVKAWSKKYAERTARTHIRSILSKVLQDDREEHLFSVIDKIDPPSNLVIPWGAGHTLAIIEGLTVREWEHIENTTSLTAYGPLTSSI